MFLYVVCVAVLGDFILRVALLVSHWRHLLVRLSIHWWVKLKSYGFVNLMSINQPLVIEISLFLRVHLFRFD